MKVALLSDCYPPRLGGIERQVHDLAHELARAGHGVEVFTATPGAEGERHGRRSVEEDGVVVHRMALPLPYGVPVNPFAPREVRRRLRAGGFDVAHVHVGVVSPFATDMVRTARSAGLPVAATVHCLLGRWQPVVQAAGHLRRWSRDGVALSAVSRMAAEQVRSVAGGGEVAVLNNGVDAAWWAPAADRGERPPSEGVRVATAIRLVSRKRPLVLLGILHDARERLDPAIPLRATVAGAGPQRRAMEAYLRARGMDWVELPGRLDREGLRRLHHASDLYLSAARLEAFGIAALEARAAGLPVLAPRRTGVDDVIEDGVEGVLADDAGLAPALARLAGDAATRERMRAHVRSTPPRQAWPRTVAATLTEYRRAGARA
ncbi:glycosyltransferase family 4 protein [Phycicoccus endophyticus]|uniref:glycosyltransferase family 4 protein n=1 Tax=Phycicoccus endophyticus TaxID=1690220 RepID=UPI00199CC433|nr:glycosyltransferase family 4 protein [Phycicoccus endophyticus]GGL35806.1 galactosyltransferase [Phycicoccus endophyticus]